MRFFVLDKSWNSNYTFKFKDVFSYNSLYKFNLLGTILLTLLTYVKMDMVVIQC